MKSNYPVKKKGFLTTNQVIKRLGVKNEDFYKVLKQLDIYPLEEKIGNVIYKFYTEEQYYEIEEAMEEGIVEDWSTLEW